ncbi:MAG: redoxin domain-containing protein [Dehalococcoidia bacterium]|nr:redoxin domain-containing protein [Dehalococcoidia bacterium]
MDTNLSPKPGASGRSQLVRLGAAALVVGVALLGLWRAGVLFQSEDSVIAPDVQAANASIETPAVDERSVGLREGNLAPEFEFSDFEGARSRLSDYRGRVVLVNFWATWCIPCKAELPDLDTLLQRHGDERLAILAINYGETFRVADDFITGLDVRLTAFGYDPEQAISRRYGIQGLPVTYFIDERGIVARVITGQLTPALIEAGLAAAKGRSVSN